MTFNTMTEVLSSLSYEELVSIREILLTIGADRQLFLFIEQEIELRQFEN